MINKTALYSDIFSGFWSTLRKKAVLEYFKLCSTRISLGLVEKPFLKSSVQKLVWTFVGKNSNFSHKKSGNVFFSKLSAFFPSRFHFWVKTTGFIQRKCSFQINCLAELMNIIMTGWGSVF